MAIQAQPPQQQGNVPLAVEARFLSQPCLLAPGCMEYGGKTFGCRRHPLPLVEVRYHNLYHTIEVPVRETGNKPPNIVKELGEVLKTVITTPFNYVTGRKAGSRSGHGIDHVHALGGTSGVLRPGSATLVLGSPGSGGTTFMRMLSGRLRSQDQARLLYNGRTPSQLAAKGVNINKICSFTPESDDHEPLLTVKETFEFVSRVAAVTDGYGAGDQAAQEEQARQRRWFRRSAGKRLAAADAAAGPGVQMASVQQPGTGSGAGSNSDAGMMVTPPQPSHQAESKALPESVTGIAEAAGAAGVGGQQIGFLPRSDPVSPRQTATASAHVAGSVPHAAPDTVGGAPKAAAAAYEAERESKEREGSGGGGRPAEGECDGRWCKPAAAGDVVQTLGLKEAENTIVGSVFIRGISGGQKRRVTIGESMLTNARILCMDSITAGLDAATAYDIVKYLVGWSHASGGILICVLQQPSPEMCFLFDDVILMAEGHELYHGPVNRLESYLDSIGYVRPSYMDLADFASELVTSPLRAAQLSVTDRREQAENGRDQRRARGQGSDAGGIGSQGSLQMRHASTASRLSEGGPEAEVAAPRLLFSSTRPGQLSEDRRLPPLQEYSGSVSSPQQEAAPSLPLPAVSQAAGEAPPAGPALQAPLQIVQEGHDVAAAHITMGGEAEASAVTTVVIDAPIEQTVEAAGAAFGAAGGTVMGIGPGLATGLGLPIIGSTTRAVSGALEREAETAAAPLWSPTAASKGSSGARSATRQLSRQQSVGRTPEELAAISKLPHPWLLTVPQLASFWKGTDAYQSMVGRTEELVHDARREEVRMREEEASQHRSWLRGGRKRRLSKAERIDPGFDTAADERITKLLPAVGDLPQPSLPAPDAGHGDSLPHGAAAVQPPPDVNFGRYPENGLCCGIHLSTPYEKRQYGMAYSTHVLYQTRLLMGRQTKLILRNRNLLFARFLNSLIMGLILATLFISPPLAAFQLKFGLALFSCIFIGFTNNAEVPAALQSRKVVYRHEASGMYSTFAYVWCLIITSIPIALIADTIYGSLVWWITGWTPEVQRWLVYLLTLFCVDMTMAAYLRAQAYTWPTLEIANAFGTGFIAIWLLTAGFYVIRSQMPGWLAWLVWVSPFFWAVTTVTNNEFHAGRYQTPSGVPGVTTGQLFMQQYDFPYSIMAMWGGIIFLLGAWIALGFLLSPYNLSRLRYDVAPGTMRARALEVQEGQQQLQLDTKAAAVTAAPPAATAAAGVIPPGEPPLPSATNAPAEAQQSTDSAAPPPDATAVMIGSPRPAVSTATTPPLASIPVASTPAPAPAQSQQEQRPAPIPFPKTTLAFKGITYTISLGKGKTRDLLRGIDGFALPGTLTALMGATGAGKTTLLDVLAFRKTAGVVGGQIRLNGEPATPAMLSRVTAYAEQEDNHMPLATVKEALVFSNQLRYGTMTAKRREQFTSLILRFLELESVSNRLVNSLSRGERKRLTIGVELVSNPSLLFLDEPTTGLDSRSAAVVMRVLKRVSSTGRTVIATIHQPSAEIFFGFDNLLLLAPGGYQVYFGPLGHHARSLVRYLECIPGTEPLPPATNPANWMLSVLGASSAGGVRAAATAARVEGKEAREASAAETLEPAASAPATSVRHREGESGSTVERVTGAAAGPSGGQSHAPVSTTAAASTAGQTAGEEPAEATAPSAAPGNSGNQEVYGHDYPEAYLNSDLKRDNDALLERVIVPSPPDAHPHQRMEPLRFDKPLARSLPYQFIKVYQRANIDYWRNGEVFMSRLFVNSFLGFLFGILFVKNDLTTFAGTQSGLGFILGGCTFASIIFMGSSVTLQFERRAVFYRERAARYYRAPAYSVSMFLTEVPYVAAVSMVFVAISYWIAGLKANAGSFFFFWFAGFVLGMFFMSVGAAFSALMPSLPVAQIASGLTISLSFLFGGLFIPGSAIPAGWIGLYYAVPTSHVLRALATNQFYCAGGKAAGCPQIQTVGPNGQAVVVDRYQYVSSYLGFRPNTAYPWGEVGWAAVAVVVMIVIAMASLQFVNHQKR